jgi:cytoskeletal protein CcmA (bactofilin family)
MTRRLLARLRGEERGVALITAALISMVVLTLSVTAVSLAIHNSEQSGRDRRRVQSVAAAEAGIDYYFSHLQSGPADTFECAIQQDLVSSPEAGFDATVTFYNESQTPMTCPLGDNIPTSALIRSVGSTSLADPQRTMEAYVNLIPIRGVPFGDTAVFSDGDPAFNSNTQVFGGESHDGDIYTNGNLVIESNTTINGAIYGQGSVTLGSNADVKQEVWAANAVQLNSFAVVRTNVISSTSTIQVGSNSRIYGDARAGSTITAPGGTIQGLRIPNSPSSPPPAREFPTYTFNAQDWVTGGFEYQVHTYSSCTEARTAIDGFTGGDHVVRITGGCTLDYPSNSVMTLRGNLAIVSDGGLRMRSNSVIRTDGNPHTLFLIFGLGGVAPCDMQFDSNTSIASGLETLMYTPCQVNLNSNSLVVYGQVFGGNVNFNSNSNLTYVPVNVPGFGASGFDEDILFIREVVGD